MSPGGFEAVGGKVRLAAFPFAFNYVEQMGVRNPCECTGAVGFLHRSVELSAMYL
jgi:hypothetical protein